MGAPYPPAGTPPPGYYRRRRGSIVWPVVLIGVGVIFLLQNFGILSWQIWGSLWRLWPLILILVGLELFLGGRAGRSIFYALIVVLVLGVAMVTVVGGGLAARGALSNGAPAQTRTFTQGLQDATSADVMVRVGAGNLTIGPLEGQSGQLAQMTYDGVFTPEAAYRVRNGRGQLRYTVHGGGPPFRPPFGNGAGRGQMEVLLNPDVQLALDVQEGASDGRLDLSQLRVNSLRLQTGASHISLALPQSAGSTSASIKGGAATIDVEVPQGVAARIQYDGGLSTLDVDQARFPLDGDRSYQSVDYQTASNKVDLEIQAGVATISVR